MQFGNFLYLVGLDQQTAGTGTQNEDAFSQFYAGIYTSSSLVAIAIQSLITSGLLRWMGIARVLFLLPLWYLGSFAAAALTFTGAGIAFLAGVAIQLGERIVIPAIHRPATELVYSQVESSIRPRRAPFLSAVSTPSELCRPRWRCSWGLLQRHADPPRGRDGASVACTSTTRGTRCGFSGSGSSRI